MLMNGVLFFSLACAAAYKGSQAGPDNLAIPTVRLSPPKNPFPQVQKVINQLEASRESLEQVIRRV